LQNIIDKYYCHNRKMITEMRFIKQMKLVWFTLSFILTLGTISLTVQTIAQDTVNQAVSSDRFAEAVKHGRKIMQALVDSGYVPGTSVAVAVDGEIVWSEGFGYANLEHRVLATAQTRFGLGSISKTFTMAGVMALVDEGLLDLDAPIETYLSDFPHTGKGITIRRIAAHQSGLSDTFAREHYQTSVHFPMIDSAYQNIKEGAIGYTPGTKTVYATGVYTIIARVMEAVTAQSYLEIMQERVFKLAGMTSVVPNDRRKIILNRTGFYVNSNDGGFENGPYFDPSFKLAGAGFLATAEDVARFGAVLLRPGLISEKARHEMLKPVSLANGEATEFALGIRYKEEDKHPLLHQPGGGIGISTWIFIYPKQDLVMALLSNLPTGPMGGRTRREVAKHFLAAIAAQDKK
jgi:CubicO group peptidase (beta-lactamase class C family)